MKRLCFAVVALLSVVAWAKEASETDLKRRRLYRQEASALESRRNELKERIRQMTEAAETLTVTAELMEGTRRYPPVERERISELHTYEDAQPVTLTKAAGEKATCARRWLTLEEGHTYRLTAEVKADSVKDTSIKFGLMVPMTTSSTRWPGASVGAGTFDWRVVSFDFTLPSGARSALLLYGLESGSGTVAFRNVSVSEVSRVLE